MLSSAPHVDQFAAKSPGRQFPCTAQGISWNLICSRVRCVSTSDITISWPSNCPPPYDTSIKFSAWINGQQHPSPLVRPLLHACSWGLSEAVGWLLMNFSRDPWKNNITMVSESCISPIFFILKCWLQLRYHPCHPCQFALKMYSTCYYRVGQKLGVTPYLHHSEKTSQLGPPKRFPLRPSSGSDLQTLLQHSQLC